MNRFICKNQGGDLISIETEEGWNFINNEIQRQNETNYGNKWSIGLIKKAGNWTWVSGKPLTGDKGNQVVNTTQLSCPSHSVMANGACLVTLIVHVGET